MLSAQIELEWADGTYLFALKAKQIEELEHKCGVGIGRICARAFTKADFYYKDVRETILQGLIGGGTPPVEASRLVKAYVDGQPLDAVADKSSPLKTAIAILSAVYFGWEELPALGESEPGATPEENTTSEPSAPRS